jgi:ABC-type sugar transport system ATPase subunit
LMRGLDGNTRMLLLDEPTAALPPLEREKLFKLVRAQRDAGVAVVFVSHNLNEVLDLAEVVSVFRNGELIRTESAADWTEAALVAAMVGHDVDTARRTRTIKPEAPVTLRVKGVATPNKLQDISFDLHRGEILGVAGLAGSGRSSLLRALAGDVHGARGEIEIEGAAGPLPRSSFEALRRGLGFLPEDRRRDGLFLPLPAWLNITVGDMHGQARLGLVRVRSLIRAARVAAGKSAFSVARLKSTVEHLSGGNQQKLLIARQAHKTPRVLLADEPTRGVDIGARADIWRALQAQSEQGLAILVVSSELEELMLACDRILVLSKGRIVEEIRPDDQSVSVEAVLQHAFNIGGTFES